MGKTSKLLAYFKTQIKSKFIKDTFWLTAAQGVLAVSGIILNIIIGNKYGASGLGVFNQVLAIFMLLSAFSALGLNNATIKKISENPSDIVKNKLILNSNIALILLISLLILVFGFYFLNNKVLIGLFSSISVAKGLKVILFCLPLYGLNKILMSFLTGMRLQKEFSIARIVRWLSLIFFVLLFSLLTKEILYIYLSLIFSEILLLLYLLIKLFPYFSLSISYNCIIDNLKFGLFSYFSEILSFSKEKLEIIIAGYFLTKNEMGIFTFSYSMATGILIFPTVIMQNINPIISKLWFEGKIDELKDKISYIKKKMIYLLFPFVLFLFLFYNYFIQYLSKMNIQNYMYVFNILLLGFFLFSIYSWLGSFLIMTNNLMLNIKRVALLLFLSVTLISLMSFYYGISGATVSVFLSSIASLIIINSFVKKVLR